ncbi:MAG: pyridoxal 5'-phosphate synthase glutaminase subunit PdxT [Actinobacteria bacterium]|nr:pyridoxal 5'-phosphate synthase glutaminase subunit PdxT [Actinomycetota bacterium]
MKFGVLALQGDFREHISALNHLGIAADEIRSVAELDSIDALIIPGGESTTISLLAKSTGLDKAILQKIKSGMYVYGSCAGMILLASEILDGRLDQIKFSGLDITVRRNGFGRQVDSFEKELTTNLGEHFVGIFIRAPLVQDVGSGVDVLASLETSYGPTPVWVRQNRVMATSFHPELTKNSLVHQYFVDLVMGKIS